MPNKDRTDAEARAKHRQDNPPKSKYGNLKPVQEVRPSTSPPAEPPAQGDQKGASAPVSGDQSDAGDKPKKAKRDPSETVVRWKATPNLPVTGRITILKDYALNCPKRGKGPQGADFRFKLYRNGMTVGEYLTVTKEKNIPNALANADVRWDVAAGFISVE